ncbi:MAG: hybrid sensor histidine kinase/response regulator [Rhodobacteraceae bacterium GWE1_64_9]|nr:MAG: hybrid sensor histidine kinase/response regulator [Rhodobacteraceae bacterium GWE1_64_9]HBU29253.1 hybrid sensor histidine kinase/response regulator [Thiobacillus sp.]
MLVIALLPALLTEFGMVAYFTTQTLATAERALHARATNAARHLADALPYALVSGDDVRLRALLRTEAENSQLSYARVTDSDGRLVASAGDTLRARLPDTHFEQGAEIRLPTANVRSDALLDASTAPAGVLLGHAEVGVSRDQIGAFKRDTLIHAALLMLAALALTGALAWRLSNRLAGQLRHVGQVVGRLACNDLAVRTQLPAQGEVGALAAGVNNMAEALQTHRSELEKRIREATADLAAKKDMAERANHAKSRFFAAASHDLRQPLHALSLFVAALKARNQQPEAQTLIDNIEASTAAMELLFNALLDISRLDAGTIEAHPVHFPLQKMLGDLEHQFSALAAEKQLRLRFRPCDITLYSDPLLIERILVNLIANAIRYTDDGGVLVACRRRGRMVRLSVIDTGRGISPDQQESVFQEFVQLHNPARDRSKGLGLGLAIVSRLGRLLGHRVDLRSRPGHGSMFSIDIPCGDARLIQPPAPTSAPGQIPADALVLLVDDESAILRGMAELFDNWNIDLVTAHSASEAEQWLDSISRVPDVIVSDYRLPDDTDGIEVITRLRQKFGRDIPAILVTGDTAPDTILRISRAGFPLLHKPLRPAKLRALLTHLIQQARAVAVG